MWIETTGLDPSHVAIVRFGLTRLVLVVSELSCRFTRNPNTRILRFALG
jgi:hypothetical protein